MVSLTVIQETRRARLIALLVFAVAMGLGANGVAQTDNSGQRAGETSGDTTGQADGTEGGSEADGQQEDQGPDPSDPDYWSEIREVQTVQRRPFQKVNRFALSAYGGVVPNNIFEKYIPVGLRLNYFILENIGLELAGSYAITSETSVEAVLNESTPGAAANQVYIGDRQIGQVNFGIVWSPFYGKTTIGSLDIGYFDFYLVGGAGIILTQVENNTNPTGGATEAKPQGVVGAGLAYYFLDNAALRLDYRQFIFSHAGNVGGVATPSEISIGAGWFF